MRLSKEYDNSWKKGNMLFILSLIVIILGTLFLILGYGIYPYSLKNSYSDDGLVTIPMIGHMNIIKDSSEYFIL
jgi:hypothetical protein